MKIKSSNPTKEYFKWLESIEDPILIQEFRNSTYPINENNDNENVLFNNVKKLSCS